MRTHHPLATFLLSSLSLSLSLCLGACSGADGESTGSSAAAVSGSDNVAFDFFVSKGLTTDQAAGIVGNLDQESSMNPTVSQYGGGPGRGIAQWSAGGRWDTDARDNVIWYASTLGQSPYSLTLQLEFVWYELETFPSYGLAQLRAATSVAEATIVFQDMFEGCGECDQGNRIADAEAALAAFGDDRVAPTPAPERSSPSYVGIVGDGSDDGYWMAGSDGGIFSFGNAPFEGSMGGKPLNGRVVGLAATPTGKGYWLTAADGGIFSFGDALFHGSAGAVKLSAPVVGLAASPTGEGYWQVASDGGVFSYGDTDFYGSMGGKSLNAPVVGMAPTPDGKGYWLVAGDGGIFTFGTARFEGSRG
jgi:hypothetical protein